MKWISVEERLPDDHLEDKTVVCLINNTPILCEVGTANFMLTDNRVYFSLRSCEWVKDAYFGDVTHWMPLPPPPKEQKKNEWLEAKFKEWLKDTLGFLDIEYDADQLANLLTSYGEQISANKHVLEAHWMPLPEPPEKKK